MRKLELNKVKMSSRLVSGSHLWEVAWLKEMKKEVLTSNFSPIIRFEG